VFWSVCDEDLDNGQMNSYGIQFFISDHCCEKLTDDGRQVMAKAHFAFGKVS
jgi:hypothetical protein